jgi:hypothetical protein
MEGTEGPTGCRLLLRALQLLLLLLLQRVHVRDGVAHQVKQRFNSDNY